MSTKSGKGGLDWADQWGTNHDNSDPISAKVTSKSSSEEKLAQAKAAASVGMRKTKVVAAIGAQKVKVGAATGFKWVKAKLQKRNPG